MDLEKQARKYAVRNAHSHNGQADMGAVIGKIKALDPNANLKELIPNIQQIVKEVNSKSAPKSKTAPAKSPSFPKNPKPLSQEALSSPSAAPPTPNLNQNAQVRLI